MLDFRPLKIGMNKIRIYSFLSYLVYKGVGCLDHCCVQAISPFEPGLTVCSTWAGLYELKPLWFP